MGVKSLGLGDRVSKDWLIEDCRGDMSLELIKNNSDQGLIDAALAIAEERENTTRRLARAVLDEDFETAEQIAKELIPNEARNRTHKSVHRIAGRRG
jgi:hypothetical protein